MTTATMTKPNIDDYRRFREMLAFFVRQADYDIANDHVDEPNSNETVQADIDADGGEFYRRYEVGEEMFKYPNGLFYHVLFGTNSTSEAQDDTVFGTPTSTEIDAAGTPVTLSPTFENGKITAFTSGIVSEDQRTGVYSDDDQFTVKLPELKLYDTNEPTAELKSLLDHQEQLYVSWKQQH
ncbi:hypothetical protein [Bifidobacterium choloepi]|uniref:Uncharacterized protein n=1 Tax=Bifidobacterium choloepi TaxID=2614131 RepID=A0A6I5NGN1_9BIFI|nr:hypothetical protein [Bifidobacterium choloepi]NEG70434.1 hypothetical protein [Bifidobacterium choloepi]